MAGFESGRMAHKPKNVVASRNCLWNWVASIVSKKMGNSVLQPQEAEFYNNLKKQETDFSIEPPERNASADSLILPHFWSTELWDNTFVLLQITKFVVICDLAKGNWYTNIQIF